MTQEDINNAKIGKDHVMYLLTDSTIFQAFPYRYKNQTRLIPEPDPVLVYFHLAYVNYKELDQKRQAILQPLLEPVIGEPMINEWHEYFGLTSGFVIYLFTTLETFINRCIPREYEYRKTDNKKTEIYYKHHFKYKGTIDAVAMLCNFYHPDGNYIVECACNQNW